MDPSKVIGNFQLAKTIHYGPFAKVKLARHMPTGELVTVKILDKNGVSNLTRLTREIHVLK